jgi:phosphate transport system ATP-binding protein
VSDRAPATDRAPAFSGGTVSSVADRPEAALVVRDVSLGFGPRTVLDDVSMVAERNAITALIGPTGCGKSTLLRSFNRLNDRVRDFWRRGSIELGQTEIAAMDPLLLRRRVGMVFQRPNPFPMSIRENVTAAVWTHRLAPKSALPKAAERSLKEVGLWGAVADRLGDSPFRLSGGQQQLLCLARALAVEPEMLLLDEPTSSLDPVTSEIVEDLLRSLAQKLTIVIVTHNLGQAMRLSKATAFLYNGHLVEFGPTEQIFQAPKAPETVSYIGGRIG